VIIIQNPTLWYPTGYGTPHLYKIKVMVCPAGHQFISSKGKQGNLDNDDIDNSDDPKYCQSISRRIGIRTIELVQDPINDDVDSDPITSNCGECDSDDDDSDDGNDDIHSGVGDNVDDDDDSNDDSNDDNYGYDGYDDDDDNNNNSDDACNIDVGNNNIDIMLDGMHGAASPSLKVGEQPPSTFYLKVTNKQHVL